MVPGPTTPVNRHRPHSVSVLLFLLGRTVTVRLELLGHPKVNELSFSLLNQWSKFLPVWRTSARNSFGTETLNNDGLKRKSQIVFRTPSDRYPTPP